MIAISGKKNNESIFFGLMLIFLAMASYVRVWTIHGVMWDDNAWLMSLYTTSDLNAFLNTGFTEMRRVPQGTFLYLLFWLHKNTDFYFTAWHALNMVTQIGTPLLLYATCLRLFDNQRLLAFLIAASLITIPLDQTLPHASSINYRLGLLLGIASFYSTVLAMQSERRILLILAGTGLAAIAYIVFMEAIVALEPGRLVLMAYMLNRQRGLRGKILVRAAFIEWLPFLIVCIPFSAYRLLFKSYGAYADIYQPNFLFWLDSQDDINLLAMLLLLQWAIFLGYVKEASMWALATGVVCLAVLVIFFRITLKRAAHVSSLKRKNDHSRRAAWSALFIGFALMLPALLLFQFLDRPITWGLYSSHGTIAQFGYALVLGSSLFLILRNAENKTPLWAMCCHGGIGLLFAAGVFFNNLNLDLYRSTHRQLNAFWTAFTQRFPRLPPEATFLFDIRLDSFYSPQYHGAYELPLNLLYATNSEPQDFRRYRVLLPNEIAHVLKSIKNDSQLQEARIVRPTAWGTDEMEPAKFIMIYYDKSGLLINREIVEKFPRTPYRLILDKRLPELPKGESRYPSRPKVLGQS